MASAGQNLQAKCLQSLPCQALSSPLLLPVQGPCHLGSDWASSLLESLEGVCSLRPQEPQAESCRWREHSGPTRRGGVLGLLLMCQLLSLPVTPLSLLFPNNLPEPRLNWSEGISDTPGLSVWLWVGP